MAPWKWWVHVQDINNLFLLFVFFFFNRSLSSSIAPSDYFKKLNPQLNAPLTKTTPAAVAQLYNQIYRLKHATVQQAQHTLAFKSQHMHWNFPEWKKTWPEIICFILPQHITQQTKHWGGAEMFESRWQTCFSSEAASISFTALTFLRTLVPTHIIPLSAMFSHEKSNRLISASTALKGPP